MTTSVGCASRCSILSQACKTYTQTHAHTHTHTHTHTQYIYTEARTSLFEISHEKKSRKEMKAKFTTHLDLFALRLFRPRGDLKSLRLAFPGDTDILIETDDEAIE